MSLTNLKRMTRKIGFRLAAWYSGYTLLAIVALFLIAYFFLSTTLEKNDFQVILSEINETESEYLGGGLDGIRSFVGSHLSARLKNLLFIRVADPNNRTVFMYCPFSEDRFPIRSLETDGLIDEKWLRLESSDQSGTVLDIQTRRLSNLHTLQLGMTSQLRDENLAEFRRLIFSLMVPLIVTGIILGIFLAFRALSPLRHIIATVQSIDIGKMDTRVSRTGSGDELDELARLFNHMLDRINQLVLGMKQSLDNVAHDLRTPLTRMRNRCEESLSALPPDDSGREVHESVLEETDRILRILDTLMDISEAETGTMTLHTAAVPLKNVLTPIVDMYQVLAENKSVTLSMDIPEPLIIHADRDRFGQALANLIDNAVKFTPENGRVHIEASAGKRTVTITIRDDGPGIDVRDIDRIWDRLYRGDQSRSQKGLGLGLSLVKAIVQAHRGTVAVTSQPGKGSVFAITLPTVDPPESDPALP
jgi:signal transduction histidine kinase